MIDDGLYSLTIQRIRKRRMAKSAEAEALAALRGGAILGSGPFGGVFSGTYRLDQDTGKNVVTVHVEVPPGGELVTGYTAGQNGAVFDIEAAFDRASGRYRAEIELGGKPVEIAAAYLGPLPK